MRNLKRALSLALASVMLLGMMVVGTSAASYPDVDSNDNVEAIEVLNAVKVMIGDRGNFKPDAPVNRHEMAVIMAKLVLGNEIADNYVGTHPFTDVASWADKYVAACYENGIAAGTSKTTFGGDKPLTAVEAAAFMLRALGYKDLSKGASDWSVPVTAKANEIRLFAGVAANPKQQLDRNQVAQLALNTLKSPVVDLKDGTFDITSGEGNVVISGGSREYIVRASTDSYAQAISDAENRGNSASGVGGYTIELGEHLYNGDLRLNNNATDDFGRPARQWEYNGKTIGTYAKTELLRAKYTEGVTGKTIYDLLGSSIVTGTNRYTFAIYMDGLDRTANSEIFPLADINRSNNSTLSGTGRGVLTEVFVDNDKDLVTISMTNTYLAKADADYSEKRDLASFDVYHLTKINKNLIRAASNDTTSTVNLDAKGEDFLAAKDVKDGDIYLVTVAAGKIQTLVPAETISDTAVDAFSRSSQSGFVEVAGTQYKYAKTIQYDAATLAAYTNVSKANLKDLRYNVYLDGYQNAIGVKEIEAKKNYVFITGVDSNYSFLAATNYKANAIFLDGTLETITIDAQKSSAFTNYISTTVVGSSTESIVNTWCTYTKSSSGLYTVQPVSRTVGTGISLMQSHDTRATEIDSKQYSLDGIGSSDFARVYANDESVFLTASVKCLKTEDLLSGDRDIVIDDVDGVATGIDNVKIDVFDTTAKAVSGASNHPTPDTGHRNVSTGSYVLFNDKGYILAAVVVGDDGGTNSNFVYVHKSDVVERDLGEDKYQWTRTVLVDGEEKVLTEIDDSTISYLESMEQNKWYHVTYKSDETVKSVESFALYGVGSGGTVSTGVQLDANGTPAPWTRLTSGTAATADVTTIQALIQKGADGDEVVVYHQNFNTNYKPTMNDARTLHMMSGVGVNDGIRIDENVKVWFKEFVDNSDSWDDSQGIPYLKSVIGDLKTLNGSYNYDFAAIIEAGRATTVIIRDRVNDYTTPTEPTDSIELDSDASVAQVNEELTKHARVIIKGGNWVPKTSDGNNRLVEIPQGKTLEIKGNFNAVRDNVQVHLKGNATKGTLIVGGTYTMNLLTSGAVNYDIQAGSMLIREEDGTWIDNRSVEINSTVVINNGLTVQNSTANNTSNPDLTDPAWTPEVIINGNVTVKAGGISTMKFTPDGAISTDTEDNAVLIQVSSTGSLTVNGASPTLAGNYLVSGLHSLHALNGTITGVLNTKKGLAEIKTVTGGTYTKDEDDVIVTPSTGASPNFKQIEQGMTYRTVTVTTNNEGTSVPATVVTEQVAIKDKTSSDASGYDASADSDNVFVDNTTPSVTTEASGTINGVAVNGTLTELVTKAGTADTASTITLNKNVTVATGASAHALTIPEGKTVTLNMDGHSITGSFATSGKALINVIGTLNVNGGSITADRATGNEGSAYAVRVNKDGVASFTNTNIKGWFGILISGAAEASPAARTSLTLTNCNVSSAGYGAAIANNGTHKSGATINVIGGTVTGPTNALASAMYLPGTCVVNISGGAVVSGANGIAMKSSKLTVENATVRGTGTDAEGSKEPNTNGMNNPSSGIATEQNSGYAGGMEIILKSGAKIESANCWAIWGNADESTDRFKLTIDSGATLTSASGYAKVQVKPGTYSWNPTDLIDGNSFTVTADGSNWTVAAKAASVPDNG